MKQNDHFLAQFYLRLWEASPGKVYVHWLEPKGERPAIELKSIRTICSERSYMDLLDESGNNVSFLDDLVRPVESAGSKVVRNVAQGTLLAQLDDESRTAMFKWLACLGPLGPNGKQASIGSAANYLAAVIQAGDDAELSKFFPTTARNIIAWVRAKEAFRQPYTLEMRVSAQQVWQARAQMLISNEYHSQKKLQWIEVPRGTQQPKALACDCLPLVIDPVGAESVTLFPMGPDKILVGLSNARSEDDVKEIKAGGWMQFRGQAIVKASQYIIGQAEHPDIFAAHARARDEDPALSEHVARERMLRNLGGRIGIAPNIISHRGIIPFTPTAIDSVCDDPRGNRFIVKTADAA